MLEHLSF